LATLVGERTAGAVTFGRPYCLSDGSVMYLAVAEARLDGERLEGRGVDPDIAVPFDFRYAGGRDPQLDRALDLLAVGGERK
jgi:carboxyl-terminal processing protease